MSNKYVELIDTGVSAAVTGSFYQTNAPYASEGLISIFSSVVGAAGDFAIHTSPSGTDVIVCVAPIPAGTAVTNLTGYYPYVRVVKAANTNGGKAYLVEAKY